MIFSWKCKCGREEETMTTIANKKAPKCPDCGKVMKQSYNSINTLPGSLRSGYVK